MARRGDQTARTAARAENRIAELRRARGLSLDDLAAITGSARQTLHHVETGRVRLSLDWMRIIGRALDVSPAELLLPEDVPYRLSAEELELLAILRALPEDRRALVPGLLASLLQPVAA